MHGDGVFGAASLASRDGARADASLAAAIVGGARLPRNDTKTA